MWIDIKDKVIPNDEEVLVIWKGRLGILYINSDENKKYCAICPSEFSSIMEMDDECFQKINYWMYPPKIIFRCDQPESSKREDFEKVSEEFLFISKSDRGGNWETESGYLLGIQEFTRWLDQRCGTPNTMET